MHIQLLGAPVKQSLLATAAILGSLVCTPLFADDAKQPVALTPEEVQALLATFEQVMSCDVECGEACMSAGHCTQECVAAYEAKNALGVRLAQCAESRAAVLPAFAEKLTSKSTKPEVKTRMIDFIAAGNCPEGAKLCGEVFEKHPALFDSNQVLAFAMRGSEVFSKAVAVSFKKAKGVEEKLLLAAYLAAKGDDAGKRVLEAALEKPCTKPGGVARAFVAARSLEKLGAPSRTKELAQLARGEALAALDAGELERARNIALEASFGLESISGNYAHLPYFEQRLKWSVGMGAHKFANAEQVFTLVETLGTAD